ncbi:MULTISPECIES: threonine--tRNA ligase [unclassified Bacillus (in: firmicutes)]|uniref:threonine--tRNA ligase n=1 Tax=unclassified Bacillus (in: firmicutes) TaxID=185979 RepID=UPI000BEF809D|nr:MULTISPECIES: threonine--tRNA ligase [unclassified Bacillus (in: firmicutes)]PEJ56628.1 threonine--tRNA ligase [Bacillus sp. AFS002410]PEL10244.1 threonine--tRNA ligase [Bacillus sp. AFS017336]
MISIKLPDGSIREVEQNTTVEDFAGSISISLKKKALGGKINGKLVDLNTAITEDCEVQIITQDDQDGVEMMRHSSAHILAQAVKRLYKDQKAAFGVGPVTADGFYYDIDLPVSIKVEDLPKIEKEMEKIIKENLPITRSEVSREEAIKFFTELDDEFKLELIRDLPEDAVISMYTQGEFVDLCRGPHVPTTGRVKAIKLLSVAGAYWRGDANNKMLQRVYGTAFPSKKELEEHLHLLEEAKKRDHRKLGKELELFMFSEEAPGMPFFLPKGTIIRNELEQYERGLQTSKDYKEVRTPFIMNQRLWEQSGHWHHYHENMYFTEVDETKFALKPMNCPGHMLVYKNKLHSYRDLPVRMCENGQVHRHEYSGALNGMMRVRTFTQDDAHIFCRPDQIEGEIIEVINLIKEIYGVFGFTYKVELSTRPEDSMGSEELWNSAEQALENVLKSENLDFKLNPGDGAFYGPKIDFHIQDALKRSWQCATIQLDFQMPEKFDLTYVNEDNQKERPVVIHRAIYGSIDRFLGILTEHFAGAFPLWLAPVQVAVLPISSVHNEYAQKLADQLKAAGIRVEADLRGEKIGYKIREAQLQKLPYMLVVGDQEVENNAVAIRKRGEGDIGTQSFESFLEMVKQQKLERIMF